MQRARVLQSSGTQGFQMTSYCDYLVPGALCAGFALCVYSH